MTIEEDDALERLFDRLVPLPSDERSELIHKLCATAPDLGDRLRALLAAHDRASMLDEPLPLIRSEEAELHDLVGQVIGPYQILEILGSGGMGAVCLAEQREPIQRPVAIKLIRIGVRSRETIERLERETRALALLSSPHVATVLDAGTTTDGLPYLVMEYVQGVPITTYCREQRLDISSRVELFLQLCDGLNHANSRGVIHRDIKPSNVLVATDMARPFVKIIDFGISKIVNPRVPRGPALTESGVRLGTPEYMSPEQAGNGRGEVDVRTDVYSAGAVLREILIDNEEGTTAAFTPLSGTKSGPVPRDLQWIVRHAMESDRTRRYRSVEELAADCRRFLTKRRVHAAPPSLAHRLTKLSPRIAIPLGVSLITILTIVAIVRVAPVTLPWNRTTPAARPGERGNSTDARTLRVPQDYGKIQEALDLAIPGDRVLVGPGVYFENLVMPDSVILESVAGADATTIDGSFAGPVIECNAVSPATVVRGFRLTHGKSHFGGGVRCWEGASPILEDNFIVENSAVYGGAIAARHGSFPMIRLNRIHRNHAEGSGGGVYGIDGNDQGILYVVSNAIWGNVTGPERASGGGIWVGGIDVSIRHNIIRQNSASGCGGAIWAGFAGDKHIAANHLEGNTALERGGALFIDQGICLVEANKLVGNGAPQEAGIAAGTLGTVTMRDNIEVGSAEPF